MNKDLAKIAYEVAKEKFGEHEFTFDDLVEELEKATGISKREFNKIVGSFYTEMIQDKRFIFIGNNQWSLKENLKIDDYRRYFHSLYDYSTDVEEDGVGVKKSKDDDNDEEMIDYIEEEDEDIKKGKPAKSHHDEEDYDDAIDVGEDGESDPDADLDDDLQDEDGEEPLSQEKEEEIY